MRFFQPLNGSKSVVTKESIDAIFQPLNGSKSVVTEAETRRQYFQPLNGSKSVVTRDDRTLPTVESASNP
jgi:hypothetical protein